MNMNKVVAVITDGVGIAPANAGNAVNLATTPTFDRHWGPDPFRPYFYGDRFCSLRTIAHGQHVGLPEGVMGNSEVGHSTIFCGKPYNEMLPDITAALKDGRIYSSSAWKKAMARKDGTTHFLGLLSDGQAHSDIAHLLEMMRECARSGIKKVRIWALTDGRDVSPTSAQVYVNQVEALCAELNSANQADFRIAMLAGRAGTLMDRGEDDWSRVQRAWDALFFGEGTRSQNALSAIDEMRDETREELEGKDFTDEQLGLRLISESSGNAPTVANGDNLILFNYRTDRIVQFCSWMLGQALTEKAVGTTRRERPQDVLFVTMANFDPSSLPLTDYLLPQLQIDTTLVQYLGGKGAKIWCGSEPSKFPHVTSFPNGRSNQRPEHCVWHEVPSVQRPPFNRLPMMQTVNIALAVGNAMSTGEFDLLIVNFPSPDMVGHEMDLQAVITAVEAADYGMAEILRNAKQHGYAVIYGGDHGNAERMYAYENGEVQYKNGEPVWHTAHTSNPVRWAIESPNGTPRLNEDISEPSLGNLSATIANLLGHLDLPAHWLPSLLISNKK